MSFKKLDNLYKYSATTLSASYALVGQSVLELWNFSSYYVLNLRKYITFLRDLLEQKIDLIN